MKIKILKEMHGTWHTLEKNQEFQLPFQIECKKTRRQMSLEFIKSESELWQDFGGFVSFDSSSHSNADGFAGSGTTAAVAHKMGRRWIAIEQMDYVETITRVRLQKVLEGEQGGVSKNHKWQGGGSFVYFELNSDNYEI